MYYVMTGEGCCSITTKEAKHQKESYRYFQEAWK